MLTSAEKRDFLRKNINKVYPEPMSKVEADFKINSLKEEVVDKVWRETVVSMLSLRIPNGRA